MVHQPVKKVVAAADETTGSFRLDVLEASLPEIKRGCAVGVVERGHEWRELGPPEISRNAVHATGEREKKIVVETMLVG